MNIITDKTIDYSHAKYWCAFANPNLREALKAQLKDKKLKESILGLLGYAGYLFTATALAKFFAPYVKNMWRKIFQGQNNKLAEVQFTADEAKYTANFDMDTMKWKLSSTFSITPEETMQFFDTEFFKKFCAQCKEYIAPILASKDSILKQLESNKGKIDKKQYKFMTKLLSNANHVAANMFDPHYIT